MDECMGWLMNGWLNCQNGWWMCWIYEWINAIMNYLIIKSMSYFINKLMNVWMNEIDERE